MYLTLRDPFYAFGRFDDRQLGSVFRSTSSVSLPDWEPKIDLVEFDDRYVLKMELAGVDPKTISIDAKEDVLTVAGEKSMAGENEEKKVVYMSEIQGGKFRRSFRLKSIDSSATTASSEHGVVQIAIPKRSECVSQAIEIEVK